MVYLKTMLVRRRGVLLKLVVALPALWLLGSLVTLSEKTDKGDEMELPPAVRPRDSQQQQQQQQPPPPPPPPPQEVLRDVGEREPEAPVYKREPVLDVAKPPKVDLRTKTQEPHEVREGGVEGRERCVKEGMGGKEEEGRRKKGSRETKWE